MLRGLALSLPLLLAACAPLPAGQGRDARWHPSPNFDQRRPNFIVLHQTTNATADPDGDGRTNAQEFAAGTNPNDLAITGQREVAGALVGQPSLRWKSVTGRFYTVERSENLSGPFVPVKRRVSATPPQNTFALPETEPGAFFYRVTPD